MIVLDANLLIYAYRLSSPDHARAREWAEGIFSGDELVGLPWQTISAFARIVTNPNLVGDRFSTTEAISIIQEWMEMPGVRLLSPLERHWSVFQRVLLEGQVRGPMITDAQLAALTVEYGGVLHTADRDFSRYPGLR